MLRSLYLATLVALQMALVARVAPPVAEALRVDALAGLAPDGWLALLQLFATGLAVGGAALALVFPGIALARHRRAGAMRFLGLPRWAVGMSLCGIVLLGAAALGSTLAPTLPLTFRMIVFHVAPPALTGGLALAVAGVLCAELLRRSVAVRSARQTVRTRGRIEVTYPPELRTRALPAAVQAMEGRIA